MGRKQFGNAQLATIAVTLIALLVLAADMGMRQFSPSDNARLRTAFPWREDGVVIDPIPGSAGGLQKGDLVVAIDGKTIQKWFQSVFDLSAERPQWQVGTKVEYQVKRGPDSVTVPITLAGYPMKEALMSVWGVVLASVSMFAVAVFVFIKRPHDSAAQILLVATAFSLGGLTWPLGMNISGIISGTGFWVDFFQMRLLGLIGWLAFIHFALIFPHPQPFIRNRRWFLPLLYILPVVMIAASGMIIGIESSNMLEWLRRFDALFGFLELAFVASVLAAIAWNFYTARDPVGRHQARWVSYAFIVTAVSYLALIVLPDLLVGFPLISYNAIGPISLIIPLSIAFAILRYRLFDIDLIINRTLVYGTLTVGVILLYVLIVAIAGGVLQTRSSLAGLILTTIIAVLLARPLRGLLQSKADQLIPISGTVSSQFHNNHTAASERAGSFGSAPAASSAFDSTKPASIPSRWIRPIRFAWYTSLAAAVVFFIALMPLYWLNLELMMAADRFASGQSAFVSAVSILGTFISIATVLLCIVLAMMLFRRRKDDRMALFLSFYLLAFSVSAGPIQYQNLVLSPATAGLVFIIAVPLFMYPASCLLFLLFPDGRFAPTWTRWLALLVLISAPLLALLMFAGIRTSRSSGAATISSSVILLTIMLGVFFAQYQRYRHIATRRQRQQIKWVVYGLGLVLLIELTSLVHLLVTQNLAAKTPYTVSSAIVLILGTFGHAIIPLSFTIAVMRYKLYNIDLIINRTLVYGALTVLIAGLYALMVGGLGTLFQRQGNFVIALLATGLVAVLFQPLRERLQRGVNHLVYGERDDPLAALSRLGEQLESTVAPDEVLPILVRTVASTLKLPYVAISIHKNGSLTTVAEHGEPVLDVISLPLVDQGERIGQLLIALRSPGEEFSPGEMELLRNIARQAGSAAHAVQLTADLQRSRANLVTAREEERRRLRRDLHDGLGPTLAGQTLKLDAALDLVDDNPEALRQLLLDLKRQSQSTVARIRRLVYDLRPPSLDDLGLDGALSAHIYQLESASNGLQISLETPPEALPPMTAAVEVAAFRIAQEALTNVIRHAQANKCCLRLYYEDGIDCLLLVEIEDDGIGLPQHLKPGIGLTSMRERTAELGGTLRVESKSSRGTRVTAALPLKRHGLDQHD